MSFHIMITCTFNNGVKKILTAYYECKNVTMAYTIPTSDDLKNFLHKAIEKDKELKTRPRYYEAYLYVSGSGEDGYIASSWKALKLLSAFRILEDSCKLFQNIQRDDNHSCYPDWVDKYNKSKGLRGNTKERKGKGNETSQ